MPIKARPIPRSVLIHFVTHRYGNPVQDINGNDTWPSSRTLEFVRVEPSSKLLINKDNNEIRLSALLFYDAVNSKPINAAFIVGDAIDFMGKQYRVEICNRLYDGMVLHHLEVGLV